LLSSGRGEAAAIVTSSAVASRCSQFADQLRDQLHRHLVGQTEEDEIEAVDRVDVE
jgi:NAD(P)H-dependent FMN reductase